MQTRAVIYPTLLYCTVLYCTVLRVMCENVCVWYEESKDNKVLTVEERG